MILVFKTFFWVLDNCFGVLSGMTDKTQKSKSKKKPKLSEEEKREKVRETLLKKKALGNVMKTARDRSVLLLKLSRTMVPLCLVEEAVTKKAKFYNCPSKNSKT